MLQQGAAFATYPAEATPWWRDDQKLLAALINRAKNNSSLAEELVNAVTNLAADDKRLRGTLRKALIPSSTQSRGRSKVPLWRCLEIASYYRMLKKSMKPGKAREVMSERYSLSPSRLIVLVKRGKTFLDELSVLSDLEQTR